jgi:organic hydroperoxide reductase OsmC/OhrA
LRPSVIIDKPEDRERAQRLIEKAERACLISRSLNSKITIEASIHVEQAVGAR